MDAAVVGAKQRIFDYLIAAAPEPVCADCLTFRLVNKLAAYVRLLMVQLSGFQRVERGDDRCAVCSGYGNRVKAAPLS